MTATAPSPPEYDSSNIFARILRGEIPCRRVYESPFALAFHDINPQAAQHVLVIPKGAYIDFQHFATQASDAEITGYIRAIASVTDIMGAVSDGYRLLSNCGTNAHQEVPHLHVHVFAGQKLGPMLSKTGS
jgi:histidine triad (HIT) family protein